MEFDPLTTPRAIKMLRASNSVAGGSDWEDLVLTADDLPKPLNCQSLVHGPVEFLPRRLDNSGPNGTPILQL